MEIDIGDIMVVSEERLEALVIVIEVPQLDAEVR